MKIEIIYTEHYALIVSDEKPLYDDYYFNVSVLAVRTGRDDSDYTEEHLKKVIAHRPLTDAPILEEVPLLPMLPKFSQEDDVENLANNYANQFAGTDDCVADVDFIEGYNKAKETYKYTEDDVAKLIHLWDMHINQHEEDKGCIRLIYKHIQSLQQLKRPKSILLETVGDTETINRCKNFNIEIGCVASRCTCENLSIPKIITNSQGQTELKGEYSHE